MEREFVAEGWRNGSLHPYVLPDPDKFRESGVFAEDYVGFDFHWVDWESLFWGALNAARREEYVQGEDISEFEVRNRRRFQQSLFAYPLLGRVFDMYEDADYQAEEIDQLREECLRVRRGTQHAPAIRALDKLILACNKASDRGIGLSLSSD